MASRNQEAANLVLALRDAMQPRVRDASLFLDLTDHLLEQLPVANSVAPRWLCWLLDQVMPYLKNEPQRVANRLVHEMYWQWATSSAKPPNRDWHDAYETAYRAEKEICLPSGAATNAAQLAPLGRSQVVKKLAGNTARIYPDTIANLALRDEDTEAQQQAAWERMAQRLVLDCRIAQAPANPQEAALQQAIFSGEDELIPIYCDWLEEQGDPVADYVRPFSESPVPKH